MNTKFSVIILGSSGGPYENNLSGYLLASSNSTNFVALDAGTLLEGIHLAIQNNHFESFNLALDETLRTEIAILTQFVKGYLISHAHLDHVRGLVINSPVDSNKNIYATDSVINFIRDHLFNGKIWPNFANEGKNPINQYHYVRLPLYQKKSIDGTNMSVETFPLSHPGDYSSTAFLIESNDFYVLYMGDCAPDELEKKKHIYKIWEKIAPLIREKKFKALFLECSFSNNKGDEKLHGHFKPKYLMSELTTLATLVDPSNPVHALKGLKVFVTHIKNSILKKYNQRNEIMSEITSLNNLDVEFVFPEQGERFDI